mmetsp:Transcript_42874/g.89562  ORF Transcript_42874/g.89562 Transcript_42874/m.89562 type:complete len:113 (+) Transcript_42874:1236-1574(+)
MCNTSTCLWDQGDCARILDSLLHEANLNAWVTDSLKDRLDWLVVGGGRTRALRGGVAVGVFSTIACCCIILCCRRYKKKMIKKPARAYMAYGESADPDTGDMQTEMAATSRS